MNTRKLLITFIVSVMAAACGTAVWGQDTHDMRMSSGGDWIRLGEREVSRNVDHDTIDVSKHAKHVREIHLSVRNAPVKFQKVVIRYTDGVEQNVDFLEDVAIGHESRSINIEGDGHIIKTVDFWYETDSLKGKKAKVTVFGRS
jgi:hypothetical protein